MKKVNLLLFLSVLSNLLVAQNSIRFNKLYTLVPGKECVSDRIYSSANGYVLWGSTVDSNNLWRIALTKIDTLGNLKWKKSYGKSGFNFFDESIIPGGGGGVAVPWGGFIETGTIANNPTKWFKKALYRFDNNGDTLWTKVYTDTINESGITVNVTRQKQYIIGGELTIYDTIKGFKFFYTSLMKTDSLGNKIWQKTYYGATGHERESLALDTCRDGGYIIAAYDKDTSSYCGSIFVMKMDSAGNPQWTKYINNPTCSVAPTSITSLKNGGYIITGEYCDSVRYSGAQQFNKLFMAKISDLGAIVWQKQYGYGSWAGATLAMIKELSNGNIIACGIDSTNILGCILKTDSNGNQQWFRYYKMQSPAQQDYLLDIQPTLDGGYVASGLTYPTETIWVVKTDSLGCADSTGCVYTGVEELAKTADAYTLYPNPSNGRFTLASKTLLKEDEYVEIYNMLGQKIYTRKLNPVTTDIDISPTAKGIYLYRILSANGMLLSDGKFVIE